MTESDRKSSSDVSLAPPRPSFWGRDDAAPIVVGAPVGGGDRWLALSDADLLADCRWEANRGPGPGGQKRNKTSSFIRLTHAPTGLSVVAGESRSQAKNKEVALRRLRLRLATELRTSAARDAFAVPPWFAALAPGGRLAASERNADRPRAVGLALDALLACEGDVPACAALLGVTPSSLVRFLGEEPQAWAAANAIRKAGGSPALSHRS